MNERIRRDYFNGKDPILDPVWTLLVCPTCGIISLATPQTTEKFYNVYLHTAETHKAVYAVSRQSITWKEAREKANIYDVLGVPILNPEEHKKLAKEQREKNWRESIIMIDASAGVHMKGYDNLLQHTVKE